MKFKITVFKVIEATGLHYTVIPVRYT